MATPTSPKQVVREGASNAWARAKRSQGNTLITRIGDLLLAQPQGYSGHQVRMPWLRMTKFDA